MKMKEGRKISMKLLIDKNKKKVLFAEAGKDSVDFLFHTLSYPLGSLVTLLTKESMAGSIGNIHESVESLDTDFVCESFNKACLLNPKHPVESSNSYEPPLLATAVDESKKSLTNFDDDGYSYYSCKEHFDYSDSKGALCTQCKKPMVEGMYYVGKASSVCSQTRVDGYVKGIVTYMITDDLCVRPLSTKSSIALLNKFGVKDVSALEDRDVTLDTNLGMELLKASLMSKTVLTDVFLPKKDREELLDLGVTLI